MNAAPATTTPLQPAIAGLGAVALVGGAALLAVDGWKLGALFVIGGLLGVSLYHAAFGFTAAYRDAIVRRDVSGVIAQLVMLGAAMALFAPVLAEGRVFGHGVVGAVAPVGLQVAFGSFIFGLGMQLGGGCGSGTLYTVGGGSTRMVITLVAFCAGGLWGSLDLEFWATVPRWRSVSLAAEFGWPLALALQFAVLGALWFGLRRWAGAVDQRPLWRRGLGWARPRPRAVAAIARRRSARGAQLADAADRRPSLDDYLGALPCGAPRLPPCSAGTRRPAPSGAAVFRAARWPAACSTTSRR